MRRGRTSRRPAGPSPAGAAAVVSAAVVAAVIGVVGGALGAGGPARVAPGPTTPNTVAPSTPVGTSPAAPSLDDAPPDSLPPTDAAPIVDDPGTVPLLLPFPEADAVEPRVQLGTIEIPAIGIAKPLMEGAALGTLDLGPGHLPGSALPGQLGNVVVGGHRVSHDHPFLDIDRLVPGDAVIFTIGTQRFTYLVESTEIIDPLDVHVVEQHRAYLATLFACHPKGSTSQRIIVHLRFAP